MNTEEPLKLTRTTRYLKDLVHTRELQGTVEHAYGPTACCDAFVGRLRFKVTAKQQYDPKAVSRAIANAGSAATYFCDSSIFDDKTDPTLWSALLARPGKLVLAPAVYEELKPWLARRPEHPVAQALAAAHPALRIIDSQAMPAWERDAANYYINLLGLRKQLVRLSIREFAHQNQRMPTASEERAIYEEMHRRLGPRGYLLAKKGAGPAREATFHTDEMVVYFAVTEAITTGRPTIILTKDEDLQEQFYKLNWLLDTHYRGMLLADRYAATFPEFTIHRMLDIPDIREVFTGENNVLIERSPELLNAVLPTSPKPVVTECWILGVRSTRMAFCTEQEMTRLLQVKGETGGLNTDRLAGRNCHIWLGPMAIPPKLRGCAAIAHDRRVAHGSASIPMLDIQQATYCGEV